MSISLLNDFGFYLSFTLVLVEIMRITTVFRLVVFSVYSCSRYSSQQSVVSCGGTRHVIVAVIYGDLQ